MWLLGGQATHGQEHFRADIMLAMVGMSLPKLHMLKPKPQGDGIRKWASGRRLVHEEEPSCMELVPFIQETLCPFYHVKT